MSVPLEQQTIEGLGQILRLRLQPSRGQRPGRPSNPAWVIQRKLSMSVPTLRILEQIAQHISNENRRVSPMQVAAILLEEAIVSNHELHDLLDATQIAEGIR